MKLSSLVLALVLACPAAASAQDLSGTWQWIEVDAAKSWFVRQGEADVTFSNGHLTAHLRDGQYPGTVDFEVTGTLTKTKTGPRADAAAHGTIAAKITRTASDMSPGDLYSGTYVRMEYPAGSQGRAMFGSASEYITLSDGFNFIGLKRDIK